MHVYTYIYIYIYAYIYIYVYSIAIIKRKKVSGSAKNLFCRTFMSLAALGRRLHGAPSADEERETRSVLVPREHAAEEEAGA